MVSNLKPIILVVLVALSTGSGGCGQVDKSDVQNLKSAATERTLTILRGPGGGSGEVNPAYGSHPYKLSERIIVTATPAPGSLFAGWQGIEEVLTANSAVDPSKPSSWLDNKIEIVMKQDVTLTALFFPAHTLSIEVKGPGSVKIPSVAGLGGADETRFKGDITQNAPGSYLYYSDEYITLVAMPGTGATFRGWTWSGDMSQIDPKYLPLTQPLSGQMMIPLDPMSTTVTVSMQRDIKLTATFGGN